MNLRSLMSAAFACLLVLAFGCGEDDNGGDRIGPISYLFDPAQVLGTSYEMNLRIDTNVRVDFFDAPLAYDHEIEMKLDVDFIVGEGGGAAAFYTVKEASIAPVLYLPDGSPGPPTPFINLIYQELVGKVFSAPINENGQPGEWSGIDEMFEAMRAKAEDLFGEELDSADPFLGTEVAKQWKLTFSALYAPTPPSQLYVDDAWKGKREASPGVMGDMTYTLASVENEMARIEFSGELSAVVDVEIDLPDQPDEGDTTYEVATGTLNGHYMVDTATGLAVRYESGMVLAAEFELIDDEDIDLPSNKVTIRDSISAALTPK